MAITSMSLRFGIIKSILGSHTVTDFKESDTYSASFMYIPTGKVYGLEEYENDFGTCVDLVEVLKAEGCEDLYVPVNDCLDEGQNFQNMIKTSFFKGQTHVLGAK